MNTDCPGCCGCVKKQAATILALQKRLRQASPSHDPNCDGSIGGPCTCEYAPLRQELADIKIARENERSHWIRFDKANAKRIAELESLLTSKDAKLFDAKDRILMLETGKYPTIRLRQARISQLEEALRKACEVVCRLHCRTSRKAIKMDRHCKLCVQMTEQLLATPSDNKEQVRPSIAGVCGIHGTAMYRNGYLQWECATCESDPVSPAKEQLCDGKSDS